MVQHVFISYSRQNVDAARQVAEFLAQQGFLTWFDEKRTPGIEWQDEIQQAIRDSAACIVLLTDEAAQSDAVRSEVQIAQQAAKPVLPLVWGEKPVQLPFASMRGMFFTPTPVTESGPPPAFYDLLTGIVHGETYSQNVMRMGDAGAAALPPSPARVYQEVPMNNLPQPVQDYHQMQRRYNRLALLGALGALAGGVGVTLVLILMDLPRDVRFFAAVVPVLVGALLLSRFVQAVQAWEEQSLQRAVTTMRQSDRAFFDQLEREIEHVLR